jgi:hypothetical protein
MAEQYYSVILVKARDLEQERETGIVGVITINHYQVGI